MRLISLNQSREDVKIKARISYFDGIRRSKDARLLVHGLMKFPRKARPKRLGNGRKEFNQTTDQKPPAI